MHGNDFADLAELEVDNEVSIIHHDAAHGRSRSATDPVWRSDSPPPVDIDDEAGPTIPMTPDGILQSTDDYLRIRRAREGHRGYERMKSRDRKLSDSYLTLPATQTQLGAAAAQFEPIARPEAEPEPERRAASPLMYDQELPEVWNIDGVEIDLNHKYKVGGQLWYLQDRARGAIKAGSPIAGYPANQNARDGETARKDRLFCSTTLPSVSNIRSFLACPQPPGCSPVTIRRNPRRL